MRCARINSWAWDIFASLRTVHGCLVMYRDMGGINMLAWGASVVPRSGGRRARLPRTRNRASTAGRVRFSPAEIGSDHVQLQRVCSENARLLHVHDHAARPWTPESAASGLAPREVVEDSLDITRPFTSST